MHTVNHRQAGKEQHNIFEMATDALRFFYTAIKMLSIFTFFYMFHDFA